MKKLLTLTLSLLIMLAVTAQDSTKLLLGQKLNSDNNEHITIIQKNPTTSVKDQGRSGTCWCFATVSFLESELLRMHNKTYDLSEMYIVRNNYIRRIKDNYLRRGNGNIGEGSIAHMVTYVLSHNGIMPESAYHGIPNNMPYPDHSLLQKYIHAISKVAVTAKSDIPEVIVNSVLDSHIGKVPETFRYNEEEYTAKSFEKSLGLKLSDYVEITSFSHHPFYERVPLEIPDNWDHALMYNVPLDVLMEIMDNAIKEGYTMAWDGDVSEKGFSSKGVTVKYIGPKEDGKVSQVVRQNGFMNFTTTDDHLMHLVGTAKDNDGKYYYIIKNSWGPKAQDHGFLYMSKDYIAAKTISIMINKNALSRKLRSKLGM